MVDFSKKLTKRVHKQVISPVEIYGTLDRASDKGPIRPAQEYVLNQWYEKYAEQKDLILKMHTGMGKTLVGLLMLQSKLNSGKGPALFLCANRFLVKQTCDQASQFGVSVCIADDDGDLPSDFIEGKSIFITTVHKLFNGKTKFGLGTKGIDVGAIVIDDAHACVDSIRDAFNIRLNNNDSTYTAIRELFSDELQNQGIGTYADITTGEHDAMLPIPYWAWKRKVTDVAKMLSERKDA